MLYKIFSKGGAVMRSRWPFSIYSLYLKNEDKNIEFDFGNLWKFSEITLCKVKVLSYLGAKTATLKLQKILGWSPFQYNLLLSAGFLSF
jgi:hypothetical protein